MLALRETVGEAHCSGVLGRRRSRQTRSRQTPRRSWADPPAVWPTYTHNAQEGGGGGGLKGVGGT